MPYKVFLISGIKNLKTKTPDTVMKEFKANVNPAKTRIDSKLEVIIKAIAMIGFVLPLLVFRSY